MDKDSGNGSTDGASFTHREIEHMVAVFQSMKNPPEVDFEKLASLLNMTNKASARNAYAALRKKVFSADGAGPKSTPATPKAGGSSTPKKPRARRQKAKASEGTEKPSDDEEKELKTPTSSPRKRKFVAVSIESGGGDKKKGRKAKSEDALESPSEETEEDGAKAFI